MNLYNIWGKFHRAVLHLAVRNEPIQTGLLKALSEIESLRSEDFPEDLQSRFAKLEAKLEAEQLITHSRATKASLYEDPSNSLQAGVGALVATFTEGSGWQDA